VDKKTARGAELNGRALPSTTIKTKTKKQNPAGRWWLTPVILPTQEAEIKTITIQSHPRQIVHKTLS
jgi:hypothetical protein